MDASLIAEAIANRVKAAFDKFKTDTLAELQQRDDKTRQDSVDRLDQMREDELTEVESILSGGRNAD